VIHLGPIALRSAWNRRLTLGMTVAAILLSVSLLLAVERIRHDARTSFGQSVSGTDLVVGPRTGPVQLMLYAVFRIGDATSNMRWESYRALERNPAIAWTIPISLGDSHRGFPVLGTNIGYFDHFRYGGSRPLEFASGRAFAGLFDAVIGAEVARRLGYRTGERIILNHGMGEAGVAEHADKPFFVSGILARTGTPVDRTVHVRLEAIEAIHLDWQGGAPIPGLSIPAEQVRKFDLAPKEITAVLAGLKNRADVFRVQREINTYSGEPLLAVLPGIALDELWRVMGVVENTLLAVSAMVVAVGLAGMAAVIIAGLNERRRELAILRSVGAGPRDVLLLILAEASFVLLLAVGGALALVASLTAVLAPLARAYGLMVRPSFLSADEAWLLLALLGAGLAASLLPAYRACRLSLADGLVPRV
jgi:putative ABC transport system permease protein